MIKLNGWILDVYPMNNRDMAIWLKKPNGETLIFWQEYEPKLYVHSNSSGLKRLKSKLSEREIVRDLNIVEKRIRLRDPKKSRVLEIKCDSMDGFTQFAQELSSKGNHQEYSLYNVDVPHSQAYLHQEELFPLAKVKLSNLLKPSFEVLDSSSDTDYDIPPLKTVILKVKPNKSGFTPSFSDSISEITLTIKDQKIIIAEACEAEKLLELTHIIRHQNPDIILTHGGDSWDIPYLSSRASVSEVTREFTLNREYKPFKTQWDEGVSYSSYGQTHYKPPSHQLKGRIHVDMYNSFIYKNCGLQGLFELSRTTRTPIQKMARSSIGTAMTNLQLYEARKLNILIPWRKSEPEKFKSAWKLLNSDKGGFTFEPKIGVHEDVGELDFTSFYPTIMKRYNISPETILCECCPNSSERVPNIDYNICNRKIGFIPHILTPILEKREKYRKLMVKAKDQNIKKKYRDRQKSLKWILVTSFGYLGYKNAKFGRIEAHEAVTAFAREKLLRASRIAEEEGFEILHGIVDSLWIKKPGLNLDNLKSLCEKITRESGLPINPEHEYRWIIFPPSRDSQKVPILNRYYGTTKTGNLKVRGIAARRRDTPPVIAKAQLEMLKELSKAQTHKELDNKIPQALKKLETYAAKIKNKNADIKDLLITRKISRDPNQYKVQSWSAITAQQLREKGEKIHAGQQVSFVVTNSKAKKTRFKVKPLKLLSHDPNYDIEWYLNELLAAVEEILNPFGYSRRKIKAVIMQEGSQKTLERWDA